MSDIRLRKSSSNRLTRIALAGWFAFAMVLGGGALCWRAEAMASAQSQPVPPKTMPQTAADDVSAMPDGSRERLDAQRDRMWADDRHKKLISDTDKLLQLATELKADVDKAGRNELSIKVIQKATEIEKLSHDVKERMKN